MTEENKIYPFSYGTQYGDWVGSNCERCKKFKGCNILQAIDFAFLDDGSVEEQIANRMGYFLNEGKYCWMCPEVEWTEEWKAKVLARNEIKTGD